MSELEAEAKFGNHGTVSQRWTEEQQVFVFEHQFVMFQKIPQLRGRHSLDTDGLPLAYAEHSQAAGRL